MPGRVLNGIAIALIMAVTIGQVQLIDRATQRALPSPTIHRLDTDAERLNRKGRKQWIEEMHWTAPDTDWRAMELANGLALQGERTGRNRSFGWTELGSRDLSGRIHCAAISVAGDSLYAGSDLGGLWKGDLNGNGWHPLSDNIYGGVRNGVAAAGQNPEVVTILSTSQIILYTEDQGLTWHAPSGLPDGLQTATRIVRDPADHDRVYLKTSAAGLSTQLYRSDDAGRSYNLIYSLGTPVGDFWVDRVSGGDLYMMRSKTLHRSDDLGENWQEIGTVPSTYNPSKIILAGSEAGAPTFYIAGLFAGNWELWQSTDGGVNWSYRHEIDDFWETMNCSITNPDVVLFAGVECWRSTNGGGSFSRVNTWGEYYGDPLNKLHADNPGLECIWIPGQGESFFPCTDGGIYRSTDSMGSVLNLSLDGLGVSQYYDIHTSIIDPNHLLAGAQDQGYQRSTGPDGPGGWPFDQLISGDYGHLTSGDGTQTIVFSVYPGFTLLQHGEYGPSLHYLDFPDGASHSWLPPILADPDDMQAYYFCGQYLYRGRWTGGDNITYTHNPQNFTTGGGSYLSYLSISPVDLDRRLAVTNTGRLWYSTDRGESWNLSPDTGPSAHYFYGTAMVHSTNDPDLAWVGGSGYDGPGVYQTSDGGVTWTPMGDGLPPTQVMGLATERPGNDVLYAATNAGPYRYDPQQGIWSYIGGTEVPLTNFWCVESVPSIHVIRFGTYGRGIWEFDTDSVTDVLAGEIVPGTELALSSFPNPFNPRTTISFTLGLAGPVSLILYDVSGREQKVILSGDLTAGDHQVIWDGKDGAGNQCPSGVYLARLQGDGTGSNIRLTLVR
jgi:photosystem II stability/assembly factor-like uncharacterized protein